MPQTHEIPLKNSHSATKFKSNSKESSVRNEALLNFICRRVLLLNESSQSGMQKFTGKVKNFFYVFSFFL